MYVYDSQSDVPENRKAGAQDVLKRLTHQTWGCGWRPCKKSIPSELPNGEADVSSRYWAHEM